MKEDDEMTDGQIYLVRFFDPHDYGEDERVSVIWDELERGKKLAEDTTPERESIMREWGDGIGCGDVLEWTLRHYDLKRREKPLNYSGDRFKVKLT